MIRVENNLKISSVLSNYIDLSLTDMKSNYQYNETE